MTVRFMQFGQTLTAHAPHRLQLTYAGVPHNNCELEVQSTVQLNRYSLDPNYLKYDCSYELLLMQLKCTP